MAKNRIIEGWHKGIKIKNNYSKNLFSVPHDIFNPLVFTKEYIEAYDVLTEDKVKSASSAILRGLGGAILLGGVGLLAGLSAKNKGVYLIAIQWKNGEKSLIEINYHSYKVFIRTNFYKTEE